MPRRVDRLDRDLPDVDLSPVVEHLVGERSARSFVHVHGQAVLERETPVTRDVVGVGVGLENPDELDFVALRRVDVLLDRVCRIDHHRNPCLLVADQVRRAPEIVVDELSEEHIGDRSNERGYIS